MEHGRFLLKTLIVLLMLPTLTGCSSSSNAIDKAFGFIAATPALTNIPDQTIAQTDLLSIDINNVEGGLPGNDNGMLYTCEYNRTMDGNFGDHQACALIPDSLVTFDPNSGILHWTPAAALGNYELKVTGVGKDGTATTTFKVGVRLKFNGIDNFSNINGLGATVNWTAHPSAASYQLFTLNTTSGLYDLYKTITDPNITQYAITDFQPNQAYSMRLEAIDALGYPDGNVITKSFTTTDLVRISMSPATATVTTGVSQAITAKIYNSDGSPQTVGGLTINPQINAGSSNGTFSTVHDNGDGTYAFTFTPTLVGTPAQIGVTTTMTFFLLNTSNITVNPGAPSLATSSLALGSNTVVSGQTVTLTTTLKDAFNNPIDPASTVTFTPTGGTSTGTLSAVTNQGSGVYSATYTGVVAGSAQTIGVSVNGTAVGLSGSLQVVPGTPVSANSTISIGSAVISSGSVTTITAVLKDINNNPVPTGVTTTFTTSGGTSSGTMSTVTNAGNGVYTATYAGVTAGTAQTILLSVDGITLAPTTTVRVVPGTANTTNSTLSLTSNTVVSGNFVTATAVLKDANNNPIDSGVSVLFTALGGTSTGTFGTVSNQGSGVYTIRYTGVLAGTPQTVRVMVNAIDLGLTSAISVTPGAPAVSNSTLTVSSATVTSGQSINVSATLKDLNSNPVPSGIVVTFNKVGGSSTGTFGSVTNSGNGVYATTYTGVASGSPQTLSVSVGGVDLGLSQLETVVPAALDLSNSSFSLSANSISASTNSTLTAVLKDLNGNPIASTSTVTVVASGGTSTGTIAAVVNQGGGTYTSAYKGVKAGTAQTLTVYINGVATALNGTVVVVPNAPDYAHSTLAIDSASIASGTVANITATLKDSNDNLVPSGITVTFTKNGGTSTGTFGPFVNAGAGVYTTTYTGINSGTAQTLGVSVGGTDLGLTKTVTVVPAVFSTTNSSFTTTSNTLVSNTSATLTATFLDLNGNPIASSSTVTFVASGGTATGTISTVSNQGGGVYSANYLAVKAGSAQTIKAYINGVDTAYFVQINVTPNVPLLSHSSMTLSPTTIVSGAVSSISATLKDINDNTIDGLSVAFTKTGGTSTGTFSSFVAAGNGIYSTTYTGATSGSAQTIGVTVGGVDLGLTGSITVSPGSFALANSSFASGSASIPSSTSTTLTVTFRDGNNNPINPSSTVTLVASGGTATGTIATIVNQGAGVYTSTFTGVKSGTATTILAYINGTSSGFSVPIAVTPGVPLLANSTLSVSAATIASNAVSTISSTLKDANNNLVDTGYTIAFTKTGGTSSGTLGTFTNVGSGVYTQTYTGVNAGTAQTIGVTVNGGDLGLSKTITVNPAAFSLANSTFTTSSSSLISGGVANLAATFKDANNNTIDGASVITFVASGGSSTGTIASVTNPSPGNYNSTYSAIKAGSAQTVKAFINGVDTGMSVSIGVSPAAPDVGHSTLAVDTPSLTSGSVANITAVLKDFNDNTVSTGIVVAFSKTGGTSTGTFSAFVNAGSGTYTTTYTGVNSGSAQTIGVSVGGADLGLTRTITVIPAAFAAVNSSFATNTSTVISGAQATLTAVFKDANGNAIDSASTVTFVASGGTSTGTIATVVNQGSGTYTSTYTAIKAGTAQTVKAFINGVDTAYSVSLTVTPGAPSITHCSLTATPSTLTSGNASTIAATLKDANDNTISSGLTVTFTKTGGTSTGSLSSVINSGSGVYTSTYTGILAGTAQTLGVSIGGIDLGLSSTITVVPAAFSTSNSSFVTSSTSISSGSVANLTATFKDAAGNPIDSSSTITFIASGGTSTGTVATTAAQGGGIYTSSYSGLVAGTAQTVKVQINGVDSGYTVSIAVVPGAPNLSKSTLVASPTTIASGSVSTITATLRDLNNNVIPSGLTLAFTKTGGTSTGTLTALVNAGSGVYTTTYTGVNAGTAQAIAITVSGADLGLSQSITVNPAAFSTSTSSFVIGSASITSGTSTTLTATFKDAAGNPIDSGSVVTFVTTGTGTTTGTLSSVTPQGNGIYTATFAGLTAGTALSIKAQINSVDTGYAVAVAVTNGAASLANSTLTVQSATITSGLADLVTATIRDANNNPISSGITIAFAKAGGSSTGTFSSVTNAGGGVYTTGYTGVTSGTPQTISVLVNGADLGLSQTIAVTPAAFNSTNSSFTTSATSISSGAAANLTATFKDANNNPIDSSATITFVASGGTSTGTLASTTVQGGGIYTSTYTGLAAGTAQTVKVQINGVDTGYTVSIGVVPGAPNLSKSTLTSTLATVPSGSVATITATLRDLNNNPISSGLTLAFTKTGGTSTGTMTALVNAGSGQYTTTYTGVLAGSAQTIGITVSGADLGLSQSITVVPAAFSTSTSSFVTTNNAVVSGATVTLTATLKDAAGNPIDSSSTVAILVSGGTSTGTLSGVTAQGSGVYTATYSGLVAGSAQTAKVQINTVDTGYTQALTVIPGAPNLSKSTMVISPASIASGAVATITATLRDLNNNPISSGLTLAFTKTGGTSTGTLTALVNAGSGQYTTTYTGVLAGSAQTIGINVSGADLGLAPTVTVTPGAFSTSTSSYTAGATSVVSGTSTTLSTTLKDAAGNPIDSSSTVTFVATAGTSTGTIATTSSQGSGVYTSTYTGLVAGTAQTVKVQINGVDTGYTSSMTVVPGSPNLAHSTLTTSASTLASGSVATITATLRDLNNNPISSGLTLAFTKTGGTSTGTMTALVNAGSGQYTTTYTGVLAGSAQTIGISVSGVDLGLSQSITVVPAAFSTSTSSFVTTNNTVVSGTTITLTATLKDAAGNPIDSSSTVAILVSGGTSTGTLSGVTSQGNGIYTATYAGLVAGTAQTAKVQINTVDTGYTQAETVTPAAPNLSKSTLTSTLATVPSGSVATITATLRDLNNNPISSGLTLAFTKTGGTSTGTMTALVNAGSGQYTTTYTGVLAGSAQTIGITVSGADLGLSQSITVVPAAFSTSTSSFVTTNNTVVSGTTITLTATLKDAAGNPIDSSSTVAILVSGGTSTGTLSGVTSQGNGIYTATYAGLVAGTAQTAKVQINTVDTGYTQAETVTPGAPSLSNSTLTMATATVTSGLGDVVTATIRDLNNNPISTGITVAFSKYGGSSTGTFGTVTNAGSGVYTNTYTGVTSGTAQTVGVTIGGADLGLSTSVTVKPAVFNTANSSFTAGATTVVSATSITLSTTLKDLNGNPIDTSSNVTFVASGGTSTGTIAAVVNQGNGVYTSTYTGVVAGTAQTLKVQINAADTGFTAPVTVTAGAPSPSNSTITVASASVVSGATDLVTATIKDVNNNPISSGLTLTFSKAGGSSTGTFSAITNAGSGVYTATYTGVTAGTAQTISISLSGSPFGPTSSISVTPGAPSNSLSTFTTSSTSLVAGSTATLTYNLVDANSNPISSGYVVGITKSGGTSDGTLSAVTNQGNGVYTATYLGRISGTAASFQPTANAGNYGPSQSIAVTVGAPVSTTSTITVATSPLASGNTTLISALVRDAYSNPITVEYPITFDAVGGSSTGTFSSVTNSGSGNFAVNYQGLSSGTTLTVRVLANGTPISGLTGSLQVVPGAVNAGNSVITIGSSTVASGGSTTVSMNLRDVNSNAITSGLTLTFSKSTGASDGTLSAITGGTSGNYTSTYTGTVKGGAQTLTLLSSGTSTGLSVSVTVLAGAPDHVLVNQPTNPLNSIDCNGPYTITLQDASNNTTSSGSSTPINFTSSPQNADLSYPSDVTLFSDSSCNTNVSSLTIPALISSATFYYKSYTPQSFTLAIAAGSLTVNNITITNSPVLSWMGSAATFTMAGSGSQTVMDDRGGGLWSPQDVKVITTGGTQYAYVADFASGRILKYNLTTNTFVGWIGHIGSFDGLSSNCLTNWTGTASVIGDFPAGWCTGGRSSPGTSTILYQPRAIALDATYLYVSSNNRVLRFKQSDGTYQGWIGYVSSISGIGLCTGATASAKTPGWCTGGAVTSGTADGAFSTSSGLVAYGGYLYVTDVGNHRIHKWDATAGTFQGWIGNVGATIPTSPASCTAGSGIAQGSTTPTWCFGGVAQAASRRNLTTSPTPVTPPNEGFYSPMAIDTDGTNLYVADYNNNRILRVDVFSSGTSVTFNGWMGRVYYTTGSSGLVPTTPTQTTGTYATTWLQGGDSTDTTGTTGFGFPTGIKVDGSYIYITDNYQKLIRIQKVDGQDYRWIGRTTGSPTGGASGCSSTPVSGVTPGWCIGGVGNRIGQTNNAFNNPGGSTFGLDSDGTTVYVADRDNLRLMRINESTGAFLNWIGAATTQSTTWNRTAPAQVARGGIDDYSFNDMATSSYWSGLHLSTDGKTMFMVDPTWHRVKQYNKVTGQVGGYIGQIGTFPPTGPDPCFGFTSGQTPAWCLGGGRIAASSAIQGYNYPFAVAADATYIYVADYSNYRIDRVRISDASYQGWIGKVSTVPTDGPGTCTTTTVGSATPSWCIGGTATSGSTAGMFNAPRAIVYDSTIDRLFVIDNTSRVMRVKPSDGSFEAVLGSISAGTGCTVTNNTSDGWCTAGTGWGGSTSGYGNIQNTSAVLAVNTNYVFVADASNHRIMRFAKTSGKSAGFIGKLSAITNLVVTSTVTFDGTAVSNTCSGYTTPMMPKNTLGWCGGTSIGAAITTIAGSDDGSFNTPRGIWADDTNLYVVDTGNNRIVKITIATGAVVGWKGYSSSLGAVNTSWTLGGTSTASTQLGGFDYPTGITGDAAYIYVHDGRNNRVLTIPK